MGVRKPYISVVVPTYNRRAYIVDSINSILNQEDAPWPIEVIVIDDGSTDNTEEIVAKTFGGRVRYSKIRQSGGRPAVPRNVGIKLATGDLIAFHDSDDLWASDKLKSQIPLFEKNKDLVLSYGAAEVMDRNSKKTGEQVVADGSHLAGGEVFGSLLNENVISTLTVVARKDALVASGCFNESPDLSAVEDYELWLRMAARFPQRIQATTKVLAYYRMHDQNISTASSLEAMDRILNVYDALWQCELLTNHQRITLENSITALHQSWGNLQLEESPSSRPIVSVIMSVYNGARYLRSAIESILSQTFANFEFIVVDDGSSDDSAKIINACADRRIRLVRQTNHGLVYSLNKAIRLARGQYLARQDDDDISLPSRLEKQLQLFASKPNLGLIGTYFTYVDEQTLKPKNTIAYPSLSIDVKRSLYVTNPFGHGTVMLRKEVFDGLEAYTDEYGPTEDMELWRRITDHWEAAIVPESLYWYRLNGSSISHTKAASQHSFTENIIREQWAKPFSGKGIRQTLKDAHYYRTMHSLYAEQVYKLYIAQQIDIACLALMRGWLRSGARSACAAYLLDHESWHRFIKPAAIGIIMRVRRIRRSS